MYTALHFLLHAVFIFLQRVEVNLDNLNLSVLLESVLAQLFTETRLLVATERRTLVKDIIGIDLHGK